MEREEIYDGYKVFYNTIFRIAKSIKPPVDYMESVIRVLKSPGFDREEAYVLMRLFGIVDYDRPSTVKEIAKDMNLTEFAVEHIKEKAISRCRLEPEWSILKQGRTKYDKGRDPDAEEIENIKIRQHLLLQKKDEEHARQKTVIMSECGDVKALKVLFDTFPMNMHHTAIDVLALSAPSYNALVEGRITNLEALAGFESSVELMEAVSLTESEAEEVLKKLDAYFKKEYGGATAAAIRKVWPEMKNRRM